MLPGPKDAPALWFACLALAAITLTFIKAGSVLGARWTVVRREEEPGLFWVLVGIWGVTSAIVALAAMIASAPWPAGAAHWAAPHINPNASWSDSSH